ncbi:MAG: tRNA-dihydrouridine synthase family protein [Planctomycetes bacterium]|nr:tRNA-dihydrouridine synthase family protein [Planctomycetota bacterium]
MFPAPAKVWLAPLTKGGNLPFRRLCVDFGAKVTMSEMAYARQLLKGSRSELALLRKHASEGCFGVQIAAGRAEDAAAAARIAVERGADFVDLNCGCPIHDTVKRGMGATLLQRPGALARIVAAMVEAAAPAPVTVKIRSGWKEGEENASEVARLVEEAGAAALAVHGRTREQRYTKAADWDLIARLVAERSIPIVGNGDILTWHEAKDRLQHSGCAAVMLGRGALVKPWLFRECAAESEWLATPHDRLEVLLRFAGYLKEHFRDDDKGRERAMRFLPWHLGFFARWRPLPEAVWIERAREHPLLQTRLDDERPADLQPLERLLRDSREEVHAEFAALLWTATDLDALERDALALAERLPVPERFADDEVAVSHG